MGPITMAAIKDGLSNTFLVLEDSGRAAEQGGRWIDGDNCFGQDHGPINAHQSKEIFSNHPQGAHAVMADASVRFLSNGMAPSVIGALSTRNGMESIATD